MEKLFHLSLVCVFFVLIGYTGCTKAGSVTGSTEIKNDREVTVSADKGTIKVGEIAVISTLITNTDGSLFSGGGTLGETGSDVEIVVSYSSNSHGTMATNSETFTLTGSTETSDPETASSIPFGTTVTATSAGILTVSVTHLDIIVSVDITVLSAL